MTPSTSTLSAPPARETPGAAVPVAASGVARRWSRDETTKLRQLWALGIRNDREIGRQLGRTEGAVLNRRVRIRLLLTPTEYAAVPRKAAR